MDTQIGECPQKMFLKNSPTGLAIYLAVLGIVKASATMSLQERGFIPPNFDKTGSGPNFCCAK